MEKGGAVRLVLRGRAEVAREACSHADHRTPAAQGCSPRAPLPPPGRHQSFRPRFSSDTSKTAVADDQFAATSTRVARTSRVRPDTVKRSAKAG